MAAGAGGGREMNIQSLTCLLFALVVWLLCAVIRPVRQRQWWLLAASYFFYASWGLRFLAILIFSSIVNYALCLWVRKRATATRLWVGICFNLLLLCSFKYLPAASASGLPLLVRRLGMPIGISFWTFQALSAIFDTYREEDSAERPSGVEFCLYLAFWPTVLSGPICRLADMLEQFRTTPRINWDDLSAGGKRIVTGLFMKVFLAQVLAKGLLPGQGLDTGFDQLSRGWGGFDVWLLGAGFGFQLFFDFAGYSHIVIGIARLFGIRLQENFNRPYLSPTPSVFWTRWHMSLSFWIRDYLFLPLAVLRRESWWRQAVLLIAMLVFGIWHGAAWGFLGWGLYHGLLLVAHRQIQQVRRFNVSWPEWAESFLGWAVTFGAVSLGWILFRAQTVSQAWLMYRAVLSPRAYLHLALDPNLYFTTFVIVTGYFVWAGLRHALEQIPPEVDRFRWLFAPAYYSLLLVITIVWSSEKSVFVYLQF